MDCEVHLLSFRAAVEHELVTVYLIGAGHVLAHHGELGFTARLEVERDRATATLGVRAFHF